MTRKLSVTQLALFSTGSMVGSGWLFSPYYGYQTAGSGVLLAWLLTTAITAVIGLSFARICCALPVVGGVYRMLTLTHDPDIARLFLLMGWVSYLLYLPLETQTAVQYLGFWWPKLVRGSGNQVQLSGYGAALAALVIVLLTWFNTQVITRVAAVNTAVSIWKLAVPAVVVLIVVSGFGSWGHVVQQWHQQPPNLESVMVAVSASGLAFAFTGFQNGVVMAHQAKDPSRSLVFSLFLPLLFGLLLYAGLSVCFIATPQDPLEARSVAPLLGLLSVLGLHGLFTLLFVDAMVSPLGTGNVYTAVTSRMLYGVGLEWRPGNRLQRLNAHGTPVTALWINAAIALVLLLVFPTWTELVSVLTSVLVLAYLAAPVSILVLHAHPALPGLNKGRTTQALAIAAFVCCTWLVYWSGLRSMQLVTLGLLCAMAFGCLSRPQSWKPLLAHTWYLPAYIGCLSVVAWMRARTWLPFPVDNLLVALVGLVFCRVFVANRQDDGRIAARLERMQHEIGTGTVASPGGNPLSTPQQSN